MPGDETRVATPSADAGSVRGDIPADALDRSVAVGWHRFRILTSSVTVVLTIAVGVAWEWDAALVVSGLACLPIMDSLLRRSDHHRVSLWSMLLDTTVIGLALVAVRVPAVVVAAPLIGMALTAFLVLTQRDAALVAVYSALWVPSALVIPDWLGVTPLTDARAALTTTVTVGIVALFMVGFAVYVARHYRQLASAPRSVTELRSAVSSLESRLLEQEEFVARVSHELRTPVTAVAGFADLLQSQETALSPGDRRKMLETIANEAVDLTNIVEDLLVATRNQVGGLTVTEVPVNLGAQLAQTLEAFPQEVTSQITLKQADAIAAGDPARVRQILRNLVTNALRYGGSSVTVSVGSDDTHSWVAVMDDGPGIVPEDRERVFEPFQRGETASDHSQGVGLGLPISRTLARAMSGDLTYERLKEQSVFTLTLPSLERDRQHS